MPCLNIKIGLEILWSQRFHGIRSFQVALGYKVCSPQQWLLASCGWYPESEYVCLSVCSAQSDTCLSAVFVSCPLQQSVQRRLRSQGLPDEQRLWQQQLQQQPVNQQPQRRERQQRLRRWDKLGRYTWNACWATTGCNVWIRDHLVLVT